MLDSGKTQDGLLVLIVTCSKSPPARVASARAELAALNMPLEIEVVDGFIQDAPIIDVIYDKSRNFRRMKRPLSRTEVAVYASHRRAWERLIESGRRAALIFEDDFAISNPDTVKAMIHHWDTILSDGRDIVKLFDFEKTRPNRAVFQTHVSGVDLVKWAAPSAGMVCYFISAEGAAKFSSRSRIFRQIDEDIKYFWELGLDIWSAPGNPVTEKCEELGGSMVEEGRKDLRNKSLIRSLWGNLLTAHRKLRTRLQFITERYYRFGK